MRFDRLVWRILLPILVIGGFLWAWADRNAIYDWWQLRDYTPPTSIAALAKNGTMTASAKHIFYVNHPELINKKSAFQQACTQTEQTIILGCYHSTQRGIDIFNVTDKRLDGIEEVTAAHEMLHAAYDRLDKGTKASINRQLMDYYKYKLDDQRIKNTINSYKKTEPDDLVNEMHSIFATEIANLPSPLEKYYQRYFSDRAQVVRYSQQYEQAFTSREDQAKVLLTQLKSLEVQIRSLEAQLFTQKQGLDADRGNIQSQSQANAYNSRVRDYNAQVGQLNQLVNQYNNLRNQYNSLVLQEQELIKAIDTRSLKTEPAH